MTALVDAIRITVHGGLPRRLPRGPMTFLLATAIRLFYLELFLLATVGLLG